MVNLRIGSVFEKHGRILAEKISRLIDEEWRKISEEVEMRVLENNRCLKNMFIDFVFSRLKRPCGRGLENDSGQVRTG